MDELSCMVILGLVVHELCAPITHAQGVCGSFSIDVQPGMTS